eukprot:g2448.t1
MVKSSSDLFVLPSVVQLSGKKSSLRSMRDQEKDEAKNQMMEKRLKDYMKIVRRAKGKLRGRADLQEIYDALMAFAKNPQYHSADMAVDGIMKIYMVIKVGERDWGKMDPKLCAVYEEAKRSTIALGAMQKVIYDRAAKVCDELRMAGKNMNETQKKMQRRASMLQDKSIATMALAAVCDSPEFHRFMEMYGTDIVSHDAENTTLRDSFLLRKTSKLFRLKWGECFWTVDGHGVSEWKSEKDALVNKRPHLAFPFHSRMRLSPVKVYMDDDHGASIFGCKIEQQDISLHGSGEASSWEVVAKFGSANKAQFEMWRCVFKVIINTYKNSHRGSGRRFSLH